MPCRATQDGWVTEESSDKTWSTGEGNSSRPLQYSCLENPMNSMKRQKDSTLKDELPGSVGAQYATGDQWRNNSRKNEEMELKQNQQLIVDVTGDRSKVWCSKEQYCIGTRHVRSISQFSHSVVFNSLWPHELQHARTPCPSLTPRVYPNSCPSSQWCHPTISSSVAPFSCLRFFPASGSFPLNWLFTSGGPLELELQDQSFQWIFRVDFL